jgi:hypothetical protein
VLEEFIISLPRFRLFFASHTDHVKKGIIIAAAAAAAARQHRYSLDDDDDDDDDNRGQ